MPDFQRWYDMDIYMSCMAYALEHMSRSSRDRFAGYLCTLCNDAMMGRSGVSRLFGSISPEKANGLKKFSSSKRWYDRDPRLQTGFKKLYMLSAEEQARVASKLFVPAQLVFKYELYCRREKQPVQAEIVQAILDISLSQGPEVAVKSFGYYLDQMVKQSVRKAAENMVRVNHAPSLVTIRSTAPHPSFAAFR
jgi:hypothetical protein